MKLQATGWLVMVSFALLRNASGQSFVNLDFESANVSGYAPNSTDVPISSALPGWSAYTISSGGAITAVTQVGYDFSGSPAISVFDGLIPFPPIEGTYSVFLVGSVGNSVMLSQTGLVPNGTKSLFIDVGFTVGLGPLEVTLGGQPMVMTQLQGAHNSVLFGADVSQFAGHVETLNLTSSATPTFPPPLYDSVVLDSIVFSPSTVPEPNVFALFALGGLFFGLRRSN